jgi:hypothetical protein
VFSIEARASLEHIHNARTTTSFFFERYNPFYGERPMKSEHTSVTDIVLFPKEQQRSLDAMYPFQAFLWHLQQFIGAQQPEIRSFDGGIWSTVPLERIIAEGLWPVLLRLAQKHQWPIATTQQAEQVASRLDQWLDAALIVAHGTSKNAARVFQQEVLHGITRHSMSVSETAVVLPETWIRPVAQFFAEALKKYSAFYEEIRAYEHELFTNSPETHLISTSHVFTSINNLHKIDPLGQAQVLGGRVRNDRVTGFIPPTWYTQRLTRLHKDVRRAVAWCRALGELPSKIEDKHYGNMNPRELWLKAQVCLALVDAPTHQNAVEPEQYLESLTALKSMSNEEAIDRLMRRLAQRGHRPTAVARRLIHIAIDAWLTQEARLRSLELTPWLEDDLLIQFHVSHWRNMDIDRLDRVTRNSIIDRRIGSSQELEGIALGMNWAEMSYRRFREIVTDRDIPWTSLATHLPLLPENIRKRAADLVEDTLMKEEDDHPVAIQALFRVPHITLSVAFFQRFVEMIPEDQLIRRYDELLRRLSDRESGSSQERVLNSAPYAIVFETGARSGTPSLKQWFRSGANRRFFTQYIYRERFEGLASKTPAARNIRRFREVLGEETWDKVLLARTYITRQEMASSLPTQKDAELDIVLQPWGAESFYGQSLDDRVERILCASKERLEQRAQTWGEYNIFRWFHAGEPDIAAKWKMYQEQLSAWGESPQKKKRAVTRQPSRAQAARKQRARRS